MLFLTHPNSDNSPSYAVKRKVYVPKSENVAVVSTAFALPNVTVPGPLTLVHVVVNAPGGLGIAIVAYRTIEVGDIIRIGQNLARTGINYRCVINNCCCYLKCHTDNCGQYSSCQLCEPNS